VNSKLYCGTNKARGQKVYSFLTDSEMTTFKFDATSALQALVSNNLVPGNASIGVVGFGTEAFYATENVTWTVSAFGFGLGSSKGSSSSGSGPGPGPGPGPDKTSQASSSFVNTLGLVVANLAMAVVLVCI
jgi:hypothetical protein